VARRFGVHEPRRSERVRLRALGWGLTLLCWSCGAWAGTAAVRVIALHAAPAAMAQGGPPRAAGTVETRVWLHAPTAHVVWYRLTLVRDWHGDSRPVLAIGGNMRARVTAYLPPDYRAHTETIYDATLDPRFSHHAVVFPMPEAWRANQPVYLALGDPGQTQPIQVRVVDIDSYQTRDLWHVRLSTLFTSVQVAMVLVILCFWLVLRDRMFLSFIAYVSAEVIYQMTVSGELFAMPGASLLSPLGYHTGECMAGLSAAFSVMFVLDFARLDQRTPRLARVLGWFRWPYLGLALAVWIPFLHIHVWLPNTLNLLLIFSTVLALWAGWLAWRRGSRQAGFFLLSWVPLLTLTMARVLQLIAGWPLPAWLEYGFPASMAYAAVIITVGLADRTLQVRRERDRATRMAEFDSLTGVFNRRAILERLHKRWQPETGRPGPLAVLFLDIDHFKQINDSRGHAAGDACLCALTGAIRAELGEGDRLARYGGEEFVAMLVDGSALQATLVAQRIAARAAAMRVPMGDHPIKLTVSIGVAVRTTDMASVESLVDCADLAQYRAKAEGRNRVVVYRREDFANVSTGESVH
jgi:diguanylate cyclase (GGDEF)-like protein